MKIFSFILISTLLSPFSLLAQPASTSAVQPEELIGTWKVDLRPTPDAEPYYQPMVIKNISGNTLKGTFYHSPVLESKVNGDWENLHFSLITRDKTHLYYTSGYLKDGKLYGSTFCPGRDFLGVWTATKETEE